MTEPTRWRDEAPSPLLKRLVDSARVDEPSPARRAALAAFLAHPNEGLAALAKSTAVAQGGAAAGAATKGVAAGMALTWKATVTAVVVATASVVGVVGGVTLVVPALVGSDEGEGPGGDQPLPEARRGAPAAAGGAAPVERSDEASEGRGEAHVGAPGGAQQSQGRGGGGAREEPGRHGVGAEQGAPAGRGELLPASVGAERGAPAGRGVGGPAARGVEGAAAEPAAALDHAVVAAGPEAGAGERAVAAELGPRHAPGASTDGFGHTSGGAAGGKNGPLEATPSLAASASQPTDAQRPAPGATPGAGAAPAQPAEVSPGVQAATQLPPPSETSGATELALVDRAMKALREQQPQLALDALGECERRFPQGGLAREREVLAIRALKALGRTAEVLERTARFTKRWPSAGRQLVLDAPP